MLPPLLAATAAAYAVTVLLLKRSILTEKIARRGQHITREYGVDPYELTRVARGDGAGGRHAAGRLPFRRRSRAGGGQPPDLPGGRCVAAPVGLVSRADALLWQMEGGHEGENLAERDLGRLPAVVHPDDVVTARRSSLMLATDRGRIPVIDPGRAGMLGGPDHPQGPAPGPGGGGADGTRAAVYFRLNRRDQTPAPRLKHRPSARGPVALGDVQSSYSIGRGTMTPVRAGARPRSIPQAAPPRARRVARPSRL